MKTLFFLVIITSALIVTSCNSKKKTIPKPTTYLRVSLPDKSYDSYVDECLFSFEKPSYFEVKKAQENTCNRDVSFGSLNGTLHLSYIKMDTSLSAYVNYANDKVDEHKVKATAISSKNFISDENNTYGTLFELKGNVASPFQLYLTDSVNTFLSGVVYFNSRPNYDSIKPVLDFVKEDLERLMETMKWGK